MMLSVLGQGYSEEDFLEIDLSISNQEIRNLESQLDLSTVIDAKLIQANKKIAIGGYLEERDFYLASELFADDHRTMHLGIDIWLKPQTPIYMPLDGIIVANVNNDKYLDYGYTIITQHQWEGDEIHCLFGHLSKDKITAWKIGEHISQGSILAYIGTPDENGGWAPHLHLQLIKSLDKEAVDYPGVCHKKNIEHFKQNCPNPIAWIIP